MSATNATTGPWELDSAILLEEGAPPRMITEPTESEPVVEDLATFAVLFDLISAQLTGVTEETEKAAFDILTRLRGVDGKIGEVLTFMEESSAEAERELKSSENLYAKNQQSMQAIQAFIRRKDADRGQKNERIKNLIEKLKSINPAISVIGEIAHVTKYLSINASIEAARAGGEGHGFAIVAKEIRALAVKVDDAAKLVGRGVTEIVDLVESDISGTESDEEGEMRSLFDDVHRQLSALEDGHQSILQDFRGSLTRNQEMNTAVSNLIMEALASVQFQDITRQIIEQIVATCLRIGDHTKNMVSQIENPNTKCEIISTREIIENMSKEYVMKKQREIHSNISKDNTKKFEKESLTIELF